MTARRPCPAAPGPLEGYAARFDDLFTRVEQRRGFREYLAGLLAPRDRNKTLTALAGADSKPALTTASSSAVNCWSLTLVSATDPSPSSQGDRAVSGARRRRLTPVRMQALVYMTKMVMI